MSVSLAVEPAYRSAPQYWRTLGPEVADLAALAGFPPDPEQADALDILFGFDERGKSVAFTFCVICCRQNMKTGLFKQAALGWLFICDIHYMVWSAHEFDTAKRAHADMAELIENTPSLNRQLKPNGVHFGAADRSINLKGSRSLVFKARTKTGGRGLSAEKVVLDEAFALKPEHIGALMPTLSVQPDPQLLYGSSAGLAESAVLRGIRDRGRVGASSRLAYLEWCAPDGGCEQPECDHRYGFVTGCALDNVDNWAKANTLLGRTRPNGTGLTVEYVQAEREEMPAEEFARERLGWWDDPLDNIQPIDLEDWAELAAEVDTQGSPQFFVDCSPNLRSASITGAAMGPTKPHVKMADYRSATAWLPEKIEELRVKYPSAKWQFEAGGPASALAVHNKESGHWVLGADEDRGWPGVRVSVPFNGTDMARACAHLQRLAADGAMTHSGDPMVAAALRSAVKRDIGDPGLWSWGRRKSSGDISPLVAVTGALWLLELQPSYNLLDSVL